MDNAAHAHISNSIKKTKRQKSSMRKKSVNEAQSNSRANHNMTPTRSQ